MTGDLAGSDLDLDVTDLAATRRAIETGVARHRALDVVVAGAGVGIGGPSDEVSDHHWERSLAVNLHGSVNTARAAYAQMLTTGRGHIVMISSLAGLVPTPLLVPYATAKAGVVGFALGLRPEAAAHGIGVSVVCPRPVDTPMLEGDGGTGSGIDTRRYLTEAAGPAVAPTVIGAAVVRAIIRNRAVVGPKRAGLLWLATRLSPRAAETLISRSMHKELSQRVRPPSAPQ